MINKTILVGRVGQQPEKRLVGESPVTTFSLATSETYKDKSGEKQTDTEWHNVVLWRGLSEIASKYVKKGDLIYIEGKLKTRSWEKDGVKKYRTEVIADQMKMLGGQKQEKPQREEGDMNENNDLPF